MRILLLTTCIYNEDNYSDFLRLTNSLFSQNKEVIFVHGVLFQDYHLENKLILNNSTNYLSKYFYSKKIISLSKARNFLINQFYNELDEYDYISFPDDDCWYPTEFWGWFDKLIKNDDVQLFYTRFCSDPIDIPHSTESHSTYKLVKNASSNTTIYKSDIVIRLKLFNESFGVGSINNGGEDTDFAIRAMLLSKNILFSNSDSIGHRDPVAEFKYRYFKGSFGVLKNHCLRSVSLFLITLRKVLVGFVFLLFGKIKISDFFVGKS
jgi:hypothetical protein